MNHPRVGLRVRTRRAVKTASRAFTGPTARLRPFPDFLIIGTQRGGTTSLYRYLQRHPGVRPAVLNKGIHYFDTNYARGPAWYRSHFPSSLAMRVQGELARVGRVITGEASPYYVFHPLAPSRIAETLPDARFILILRDPVARSYSHYQHEVARGFEDMSFEEALKHEPARLANEEEHMVEDPNYYSYAHQHHSYVARGLYLQQIQRWHALYPPDRLLIVDSSDLFGDPDACYRRVLRFLGLEEISLRSYERMNARSYGRMTTWARDYLRERFAQPNRELAAYLGRSFAWDS